MSDQKIAWPGPTVLWATDVFKTYQEGDLCTEVLRGVSMQVATGETVAIVGSSGSGKSTLLHLLGGLDQVTKGNVVVAGHNLAGMSSDALGVLRCDKMGFIYQFHHLLKEFTALENVAMPLLIRGTGVKKAKLAAGDMLGRVGLGDRLHHKPSELSGGERQRCAVARALVTRPAIVFADEPTGNLDESNAEQVLSLMLDINQETGASLIMVTHDLQMAHRMDRTVRLHLGKMDGTS